MTTQVPSKDLLSKLRAYHPTSGYARIMRQAADEIERLERDLLVALEQRNQEVRLRQAAEKSALVRTGHEPNVSLKDAYAKWRESHAGWCLSGPPEFGECNCSGTTKCAKHGPHALGECPQCDKLSEARSIVATALIPPTPGEPDGQ